MKFWDVECKEPTQHPLPTFKDLLFPSDTTKTNKKPQNQTKTQNGQKRLQNLLKILNQNNFTHPTPIQTEVIPRALTGSNILAQSHSGTGKTISFLSTIFAKIHPFGQIQALVITPTRELCNQIYELSLRLNSHLDPKNRLKIALFIGGMPMDGDHQNLQKGVDLLIGTTGRLLLHLNSKNIDFKMLRLVVLDEADILIKGKDFRRLFGAVRAIKDRRPIQICCFSATYTKKNVAKFSRFLYPCVKIHNQISVKRAKDGGSYAGNGLELADLGPKLGKKGGYVQSLNLENLEQFVVSVQKEDGKSVSLVKMGVVVQLLKLFEYQQVIIFYNDKGRGDQIVEELK